MKNLETKNKASIVDYWCYVTSKKRKTNLDSKRQKEIIVKFSYLHLKKSVIGSHIFFMIF